VRRQQKRRAALASSTKPHATGCGVPCSQPFTGVATALQASSNTYPTGFTTATKNGALAPLDKALTIGNDSCAGNE